LRGNEMPDDMMQSKLQLDTEAIAQAERSDIARFRQLSLRERGEWLAAVCRAAAELEASRLAMGLSPAAPAPWPDSTWQFLAAAGRNLNAGQSL
jgi:hypothetical protein